MASRKSKSSSGATPRNTGVGLLKLKLGACVTGPTARLRADLFDTAQALNRARNTMARAWQRWHEDHPDWTPGTSTNRKGEPVNDPAHFPACVPGPDGQPVGLSTWLYHQGRAVAPTVEVQLMSAAAGEVASRLTANMPYNHGGSARRRWQAILSHEVNIDTARSLSVPVPNRYSAFVYAGAANIGNVAKPVAEMAVRHGASGCVVALPLFSPAAGRNWTKHVVRVEARQLTEGNRRVLKRVASGEWKWRDSELMFDGQDWFLCLCYEQPPRPLGLDAQRPAVLVVNPDRDREKDGSPLFRFPMAIATGQGDGERRWVIGQGPLLKDTFGRLAARRRNMRKDYGTAGNGRRGHGRQRNERDQQPVTRRIRHLVNNVNDQTVAEVIRFCARFDCGRLVYCEPGPTWRSLKSWYARQRIQWDWTSFRSQLSHQCWLNGIELEVVRAGKKEGDGAAGVAV